MITLLKNGTIFSSAGFEKKDIFISNGKVFCQLRQLFRYESRRSYY